MAPNHRNNKMKFYPQKRRIDFKPFRKNRAGQLKTRTYYRGTDCWNCGSKNHFKNKCPMPSSLKCSYCQRKGVRSDECLCRSSKAKPTKGNPQQRIETAVFVKIEGKSVKAWFNPSTQNTLLGKAVADLIIANTAVVPKRVVLRDLNGLKLASRIPTKMCTRRNNIVTVEGYVAPEIPDKIVVLGMDAIKSLGFKFYIGGQQAKVRMQVPETLKTHSYSKKTANNDDNPRFKNEPQKEDDAISFLDEGERRQILDWD